MLTVDGDDTSKTKKTSGDITVGGFSAIRTLHGNRKRRTLENHTGTKNPEGKDIVLEPSGRRATCNKTRIIKIGKRKYRLILKVPRNISSGRIEISAVGEDNTLEKLFVTAANSADSNNAILATNDQIAFKNLRANVETKINFELPDEKNYTMRVDVYEN